MESRRNFLFKKAFTITEMLAVIATVCVLLTLLIPALTQAKNKSLRFNCQNNLRQLQLCSLLYSHENDDLLPPNQSFNAGGTWRSTADSWIGNSNAYLDSDTTQIQNGLLFQFGYNRNLRLYKCPADISSVAGTPSIRRTRSYSICSNLDGSTNQPQLVLKKLGQIESPSRAFVFVDESADSIDDGHFFLRPFPSILWANLPTDRHSRGATMSFADGHVEYWRWKQTKQRSREVDWHKVNDSLDLKDLRRMQSALPTGVRSH